MGKGQDCRRHFAAVIKNVAFNSFAVKRLVYVYLLKYAEQEPDLALLSINSFQKDLLDPNPMIRSVALRVLCSIKVTIIASVQLAAVKKGAVDMSPYVRKAVSVSLVKISKLEPSSQEEILEILKTLLDDKSAIVLGSAIQSMNALCPDRFDLIHKHFKKICSLVLEGDEWGQIQILKMMDRYCRLNFTNPSSSVHTNHSEEQLINGDPIIGVYQKDTDYELFLESCKQLLASKNPLIVMMASRISYDQPLDNPTRNLAARSLIRCLSRPKQEQHMLLVAIKSLIIIDPSHWFKHITSFAVYPTEIDEIKILKLDILVLLATEANTNWIVPELKVRTF
jgi:AP-3 complex subunit beta